MSYMDELMDVDEALREMAPRVVERHRECDILTWALLHQIEAEIIDAMAATGEYSETVLRMIRSADVLGYPKDSAPASFAGAELIPVVFSEIQRAWNNARQRH